MMGMLKSIYEEEMIRAMEEDRDRASFKISPPTYRYGGVNMGFASGKMHTVFQTVQAFATSLIVCEKSGTEV